MEPTRVWNSKFIHLLCIEACLQMGGFLTRSINANYATEMGASIALAGFLAGLMATAALIMRPFSGAISDRLSKKHLLVLSCTLFTIAAFGCAVLQSLLAMGVCLAIQGCAFAFKSAIVISYVPQIVPKKYVGTGVGWMGLAYTVAMAIGPAIGFHIGIDLGYAATYAVSGVVLFASLVLSASFNVPADPSGQGISHVDDDLDVERCKKNATSIASKLFYIPALSLSAVGGMLMVAQGVTSSFVLMTGEMRGIETVSLYFVFYSIANVAARPLAGRLSDEWGVRRVVPPMMVVAIAGMLLLAYMGNTAGVVIGGLCMGLGQASAYAALQSESVRGVPACDLGKAANTYFIGPDLAMGLGPVVGGAILGAFGPVAMYVFCAGCILFALVMFAIWAHRGRVG